MLTISRHLKRGIALETSRTACTSDRKGLVDAVQQNGRLRYLTYKFVPRRVLYSSTPSLH